MFTLPSAPTWVTTRLVDAGPDVKLRFDAVGRAAPDGQTVR